MKIYASSQEKSLWLVQNISIPILVSSPELCEWPIWINFYYNNLQGSIFPLSFILVSQMSQGQVSEFFPNFSHYPVVQNCRYHKMKHLAYMNARNIKPVYWFSEDNAQYIVVEHR